MSNIPEGWEYWATTDPGEDPWELAVVLKQARERLYPELFVRVHVIRVRTGPHRTAYWILRKEEKRQR